MGGKGELIQQEINPSDLIIDGSACCFTEEQMLRLVVNHEPFTLINVDGRVFIYDNATMIKGQSQEVAT